MIPAAFVPEGTGKLDTLVVYPAGAPDDDVERFLRDTLKLPHGHMVGAPEFRAVDTELITVVYARGGMGVTEVVPLSPEQLVAALPRDPWMHLGILVECADPIRDPKDLKWWVERGVVAVGLTWARGSRYAAGNSEPSCSSRTGLTPLGRDMVQAMDALGVVHDLSHLSWRAMDDLLSMTSARVIASHSNCSALLGEPGSGPSQRHLRDEHIREIARRGGVIGLNLFSAFLRPGITPEKPARATLEEAVAHVEHVCEVAGDRRHVGLGSDMDGGFGASMLPTHVDRPGDLERLADALRERDWSADHAEEFRWRNWAGFWGRP
jgi:membrane dipeptidase